MIVGRRLVNVITINSKSSGADSFGNYSINLLQAIDPSMIPLIPAHGANLDRSPGYLSWAAITCRVEKPSLAQPVMKIVCWSVADERLPALSHRWHYAC